MEMKIYAPIVLFAYKRLDKLKSCIESLEKCNDVDKTDLVIFGDGYKNDTDKDAVKNVQQYIEQYKKNNKEFHVVRCVLRESNLGLANSVISGVTEIINEFGRVIVVEDDLIVSKDFIQYMNSALAYYEKTEKVGVIGGFTPSVGDICINPNGTLKSRLGCCLGWATWKNRWEKIEWDVNKYPMLEKKDKQIIDGIQYGFTTMLEQQIKGEIDSWAIRFDYHAIKNGWWTIYPNKSKVQCIGFDDSSTHATDRHDKRKKVDAKEEMVYMYDIETIPDVSIPMRQYFKPTFIEKIRYFVMQHMKKDC